MVQINQNFINFELGEEEANLILSGNGLMSALRGLSALSAPPKSAYDSDEN